MIGLSAITGFHTDQSSASDNETNHDGEPSEWN